MTTRRLNQRTVQSCANTWATAISRSASPRVVNDFCRDQLNPYINFHRPCLFAETITDAKGRQRKRYPYKLMMTPYEKLKSLPKAEQYLKPGITFPQTRCTSQARSATMMPRSV